MSILVRKRPPIWLRAVRMALLVMLLALVAQPNAQAEGSADLCKNGGYRPYTERYAMETAGEQRDQVISVYLQAGETVYFGSSVSTAKLGFTNAHMGTNLSATELAKLNATDILVMTPDWNNTTNSHAYPYVNGARDPSVLLYDTTDAATETTQGYIATPAREAAGPAIGGNTAGYTPYSLTASKSGVYRFKFFSAKHSIENPTSVSTSAAWNQKGSCVAAWDTTVVKAGGAKVAGRVYTDTLFLNMGSNLNKAGVLKSAMYAITDDGYCYKVDFNGMDPFGFVFFANNRGLLNAVSDGGGTSLYHSVKSDNNTLSDLGVHDIILNNIPTYDSDHTYLLFFNQPDPAALTALSIPSNPTTDGSITNFRFEGNGCATSNRGFVGRGGNFVFDVADSVSATSYQIELDFSAIGGGKVVLSNTLKKGQQNALPWNGKDALGRVVPVGSYGLGVVSMKLKGGEIHFPLMDVENNYSGIKITRLSGSGSPDSTVYYNNSGSSNIGDTSAPWTAAKNWNMADYKDYGSTGVDSSGGAMAYRGKAGDQTALDLWAYYDTGVDLQGFAFTLVDTSLTVTKQWQDVDAPADWQRPDSLAVQLYADNVAQGPPISLTGTGDNWQYTFEHLTPVTASGKVIKYTAKETLPTGYTVVYGEVTGTAEDGYFQALTNTYAPTSVTVNKLWDNDEDEEKPDSVVIHLKSGDTDIADCTLNAGNNWTNKFENLDPTLTYSVTEDVPDGYTCRVGPMKGSASAGYTCTVLNLFDAGSLATVGVIKDWENTPDELMPEAITVALWRSTDNATWEPATDRENAVLPTVDLNAGNLWMQVWSQLPTQNAEGAPYTYQLTESINGHSPEDLGYRLENEAGDAISSGAIPLTTLDGSHYSYVDVVNIYQTAQFTVQKQWNHGINQALPEALTVQLQCKTGDAAYEDYGVPVTLTEADGWQYTWQDLPSVEATGATFDYRAVETALPTYLGITGEVTGDWKTGYTQALTNTYRSTALTVTKSWDFGTQPESERPTMVRCTLFAQDGSAIASGMLKAENDWQYVFHDLPCFNADGSPIDYLACTVGEDLPDDYTGSSSGISGSSDVGYQAQLTNVYLPPEPPTPKPPTPVPPTPIPPTPKPPTPDPGPTGTPAPVPTLAPTPTVTPIATTIPGTGDAFPLTLWAVLATMAGLGLAGCALTLQLRRRG